jgi:hypothetical protein
MVSGNSKLISEEYYLRLLSFSEDKNLAGSFDQQKHQWVIEGSESWLAKISIPWDRLPDAKGRLNPIDDFHLGLVMIRAGIAVTGYFHETKMLDHKVFRAYMVRQKQGKSQIKYLKTKGKSRAGSRLRLGESERFFEEINERLQHYDLTYPITRWGISCAKTLWPYYFGSETPPPFLSKDDTLMSIPFHVQQPDFATLKEIHFKLTSFHLLFSDEGKVIFNRLIENNSIENKQEDDW